MRCSAYGKPERKNALPSHTQGGSRMPELGPYGSVRGALSNERPYRDIPLKDRTDSPESSRILATETFAFELRRWGYANLQRRCPNLHGFVAVLRKALTAPIIVIALALMRSVYDNKNANIVIIAVSVVALGAFFLGIRQQAAIGDKSFLTAMIPHHAG